MILTLYQYWLENDVNFFSLHFNVSRQPIYDLKTDENDPFLTISQKTTHHFTYTTFLKHKRPQNYYFSNYKYTSPYTLTHFYTIDHSRNTVYLRNFDPIKQYLYVLP